MNLTGLRRFDAMFYIPPSYPWQESYFDAIFETDVILIPCRIYDALEAVERRRRAPVHDEEKFALLRAEVGIKALIDESNAHEDWFDQYGSPNRRSPG
jgi:hypothetical protein